MPAVFLAAMVLAITSPANAASTDISSIIDQYPATTTYTITRKGKKIGTHEVSFSGDNSDLTVTVKSRIRVTVLKIPVFIFDYDAKEVWKNGELISATSEVRENDKQTNVAMQSNASGTVLQNLKGTRKVERLHFTSNHWNPAVTKVSRVFNTLNGSDSSVKIKLISEESTENGLDAIHYRYTGDIQADTWYSTTGKWLQLQFKGEDGSEIRYTIKK